MVHKIDKTMKFHTEDYAVNASVARRCCMERTVAHVVLAGANSHLAVLGPSCQILQIEVEIVLHR